MPVDFLMNLLKSDPFQTVVNVISVVQFVGSGVAKLVQLKKNWVESSHEWQLINCLEQALISTREDLLWENDSDSVTETFVFDLLHLNNMFAEEALRSVFCKAIGHDVTDHEIEVWKNHFIIQLSKNEHSELRNYFLMHHLLTSNDENRIFSNMRVITPQAPIWINEDIICRDELVNDLTNILSESDVHLQLIGMGGVGKTEILNKIYAELARSERSSFDHIGLFYYDGKINENIVDNLDYPKEYKGLHGDAAAKQYLQNLCNEKRVLLIFDDLRKIKNKYEQDSFVSFLKTLRASVLVASRWPISVLKIREVGLLSTDECVQVFESQYKREMDEEERGLLRIIIEKLAGNNTLIVSRLGSMARCYCTTINELFDYLDKRKFCLPNGLDDDSVQQEINKIYPALELKDFAEQNIVEAFSFFPAIPLSKETCVNWLMQDAHVDEDKCALLMAGLANQTWLTKLITANKKTFYLMHQITREAVQDQLKIETANHENLLNECANTIAHFLNNFLLDDSMQSIPFAISIYNSLHWETMRAAILARAIGGHHELIAKYTKALDWYQKALNIVEKRLDEENSENILININYSIGTVYYSQGNYHGALEQYKKVLEIFKKVSDINRPEIVMVYNCMALVFEKQEKYNIALKYYSKALEICKNVLSIDHPDAAKTYNNIAGLYFKLKNYDLALEWFQLAMEIYEKVMGKNHPDTASIYSNIAGVLYQQGDYHKAFEWYQKTHSICEEFFGKVHPFTAAQYSNIGAMFFYHGDCDKAFEWYQKAFEIRIEVLGEDHLYTADSYYNIAGVFKQQGDYVKALDWYQKALKIRENNLGNDHQDVADSYNKIAEVYFLREEYEKSLESNQKALEIREKGLGKNHPDTANTYYSNSVIYSKLGDHVQAAVFYQKALEIQEKVMGDDHQDTNRVGDKIEFIHDELEDDQFPPQSS